MTSAAAPPLPDVPRELVEAGASGRLVVLVGAGASVGAGLPDWKGLLADLRSMAQDEATNPAGKERLREAEGQWGRLDDLLKASLLASIMGKDWVPEAIARRFREASSHPSPTHQALAMLRGATFVTTNYDQLLEAALRERTGRPAPRVLLSDVEGIRELQPGHVLKLHGDVDAPRSIVLKAEDFYRVGHEAPRAWKERLKALLQPPYQILLVGYGYADIDVQEVVNELRGAYEGKLRGPFWLEVESFVNSVKADALALRPVWLHGYDQVAPWLSALAGAIEAEIARAPVVVKAAAYAGLVHEELRKKADAAQAHFEAQRFEEAEAVFVEIARTAEGLATADPDDDALQQWIARSRLNAAGCAICLQSPDAADRLRLVAHQHLKHLRPQDRAQLSMGLAQSGDVDQARRVLPADGSDEAKAAAQLIEVKEGRLPDRPWASSPILRLHLAAALVDRGELDEAARMARDLLKEDPEDVLLVFYNLVTLQTALGRSVHDEPPLVQPIPIGDARLLTVEAIERHLDAMTGLPEVLAGDLRRVRFNYFYLAGDDEQREGAKAALGDDWKAVADSRSRYELDLLKAEALAREGKLDQALALVEPTDHPWRYRYDRAQILAVARHFDDALAEVSDLACVWPGRAPIEHLLTELLAHGPHPEEALPHARAAFAALPGRRFRLLLGRCLLAAGLAEEAWKTLEPIGASGNPELFRLRALAAERISGRVAEAPARWADYLEVAPEDDEIRVRIARLRFEAGDLEGAAAAARDAIDRAGERLGATGLFACAQILRGGGRFDDLARTYVRKAADLLHAHFRGDKEAEHHRFILLGALGFPAEAPPVDMQALVAAGTMRAVRVDEWTQAFQDQVRSRDMIYRAYRTGHLPFESLCALTQTAAARYLVRFLNIATDRGPTALSAPVALDDELPVPSLSGRRVLVGELELLLLQRFDCWQRLRAALAGGKLVVFRDVWERLVEETGTLEASTQRVALEQEEKLLHLVLNSPGRFKPEEEPWAGRDEAWATAKGVRIVAEARDAEPAMSFRTLVEYLDREGYLDPKVVERLSAGLPASEAAKMIDGLPDRLCLSYPALQTLFDAGALDALVAMRGTTFVVGPEAMSIVRARRDSLREEVEAADLAAATLRAAGVGRAEQWIDATLLRPVLADLPDVNETDNTEWARQVSRRPLELALSSRQALVDDPDLLLLTADFFVTSELGSHHQQMLALAWPSPAIATAFILRMRPPHDREIRLPALVRHLWPDQNEAKRKLTDMARLGFADALGPEDLLSLARAKGATLDRQEPRSILDRLEWMVREPDHLGASMAFLRLADVYAKAIWEAFCGKEKLAEEDARRLTFSLLNRAEAVGDHWENTLVQLTMRFATSLVVGKPSLSFEEPRPGQTMVALSVDSPGGKLWSCLVSWAGGEGKRRAAYGRAVRDIWLHADELSWPSGPDELQCSGLLLSLRVDALSPIHPEIAAPAILSANWSHRPLSDIYAGRPEGASLEETFETAARVFEADASSAGVGDSLIVFRALRDGHGHQLVLPPEVVLLRMRSGEDFKAFTRHLAKLHGRHDGRACDLLNKLSQEYENRELRREVARLAVAAPWRIVRDSPTILRTWGWHQRRGMGGVVTGMDLPTLRRVLSEPETPLDHRGPLWDALMSRIAPEGIWENRDDQIDLGSQACEVPGFLAALMASTRVAADDRDYVDDVETALDRLDHPDDHPAARLAADIYFLRLAAERRPFVSLPQGEIDLRESLPSRLVTVLRSVMKPQAPDSQKLAGIEAGLLRLCGTVVQDLSSPRPIRLMDWLWLTYRLFQWLWAQLDAMDPDARRAGLASLGKVCPGPSVPAAEANDLLNPFRFDGERFDHRLATVLYAVTYMEALPFRTPRKPDDAKPTPRAVASSALDDLLIQLASRPLSKEEQAFRSRGDRPSRLDWFGPSAVPDLALQALLGFNSGAVLRISEESRRRWILDLPSSPADLDHLSWPLTLGLVSALTEHARGLTPPERTDLEGYLHAVTGEGSQRLRWIGFNNLFGAGSLHLEAEARALLLQNLTDPIAPQGLGLYLRALSFVAPDRLIAEAEQILATIEAHPPVPQPQPGEPPAPDAVAFAWGLGAVVVGGDPSSIAPVQDLLRRLAQRPPYKDNDRMRQLLGILGMT